MKLPVLILFAFASFFHSTSAQSALCQYVNGTINGVPSYFCYLVIDNPAGTVFQSIDGTHLEGFGNDDVAGVFRWNGTTSNVPSVVCSQFPNMLFLDLSFLSLSSVAENAFNACTNLEWLRLYWNPIGQLPANVFANNERLTYLDLDRTELTTLPENIFSNLVNLESIELRNNPFTNIPGGLFRNLVTLRTIYLQNASISEINQEWFTDLANLQILTVYNNQLTEITEQTFAALPSLSTLEISRNPIGNNIGENVFNNLPNLEALYMTQLGLSTLNPNFFVNTTNLQILYIYWNNILEIPAGVFDNLVNLYSLDIGGNLLDQDGIPGNAFANLQNLNILFIDDNYITLLNPEWFTNLVSVWAAMLDFNYIEELQEGVFAGLRNIQQIGLWWNDLKTVNRSAFGDLSQLVVLDLDQNVINAVDERVFNDATVLSTLFFWQNLCFSGSIFNFQLNREQNMDRLSRCTVNFRYNVDTTTEADDAYRFFEGRSPGIAFRVQSSDELQIALTPFNFPWTPMLEIFIGTANNTRSVIRRNQDTDVVTVPTPNIIQDGQNNGFRVTWANHAILVFREGAEFPFMGFTMIDFFPVNFFGLRTPANRAVWSVQPII